MGACVLEDLWHATRDARGCARRTRRASRGAFAIVLSMHEYTSMQALKGMDTGHPNVNVNSFRMRPAQHRGPALFTRVTQRWGRMGIGVWHTVCYVCMAVGCLRSSISSLSEARETRWEGGRPTEQYNISPCGPRWRHWNIIKYAEISCR